MDKPKNYPPLPMANINVLTQRRFIGVQRKRKLTKAGEHVMWDTTEQFYCWFKTTNKN